MAKSTLFLLTIISIYSFSSVVLAANEDEGELIELMIETEGNKMFDIYDKEGEKIESIGEDMGMSFVDMNFIIIYDLSSFSENYLLGIDGDATNIILTTFDHKNKEEVAFNISQLNDNEFIVIKSYQEILLLNDGFEKDIKPTTVIQRPDYEFKVTGEIVEEDQSGIGILNQKGIILSILLVTAGIAFVWHTKKSS